MLGFPGNYNQRRFFACTMILQCVYMLRPLLCLAMLLSKVLQRIHVLGIRVNQRSEKSLRFRNNLGFLIKLQHPGLKFPDNTLHHIRFHQNSEHIGTHILILWIQIKDISDFLTHDLNLVQKNLWNIRIITLISRTGHQFQAKQIQYG